MSLFLLNPAIFLENIRRWQIDQGALSASLLHPVLLNMRELLALLIHCVFTRKCRWMRLGSGEVDRDLRILGLSRDSVRYIDTACLLM